MHLAQIEMRLASGRVFHDQGPIPVSGLPEKLMIVCDLCVLEVHVSQILHSFFISFLSSFFVELESFVPVLLYAMPKLVASPKVVDCSCETFIRSFLEPLGGLMKVVMLVVEHTSKRVHTHQRTICCRFLHLSLRRLDVLVNIYAILVVLSEFLESLSVCPLSLACFIIE